MISIFRPNSDGESLISSLKEGTYGPHLIVFSTIASSAALLVSISLSISYAKLAAKPATSLVQTDNGVLPANEQSYLYRSPKTLRNFSAKTLSMLMNWNGKTLDQYGVLVNDKGVSVGSQNKVPTAAYEASHAFTTDGRLRTQVVDKLSNWVTPGFFKGEKQQQLEIKKIMIPQQLEGEGRWKVSIIAHRVTKQGEQTDVKAFNRSLYLRAVPVVDDPIPENSTPEQKAFYRVRQHGLEIYRMENFSREDL